MRAAVRAAAANSAGVTTAAYGAAAQRGRVFGGKPRLAAGGSADCRSAHRSVSVTAATKTTSSTSQEGNSKPMEVEVKIRLPDQAAYDTVAQVLAGGKKKAYQQENYFFDGSQGELEKERSVLRLRFFGGDDKAVITCKGQQILKNGIGTAPEVEEDVPGGREGAVAARQWLQEPQSMMRSSPLLQKLNQLWGIQELKCLGGFRNLRTEYEWEGHTLELDLTAYEWGTLYEIECETTQPEVMRDKLEGLLTAHNIQYSYSKTSKFANFINKTLL